MFNWFKNKKKDNLSQDERQSDENKSIDFKFSFSEIDKKSKFSTKTAWVKSWEKQMGDFITKSEDLCKIEIKGKNINGEDAFLIISAFANKNGYLEILKDIGDESENHIIDCEKIFIIHTELTEELKEKLFHNIPNIYIDEFRGSKELKWLSVGGKKKKYSYDSEIYDSLILYSDDNTRSRLLFSLNNIENKDYIVFKYSTKNYKITIGSVISFLFENGEILDFEISLVPYKYSEHIFETRVRLTTKEIETLENQVFSKWQIKFPNSHQKITGTIDSLDMKFVVKKFAKDYCYNVKNHINDYLPLTDKEFRFMENIDEKEDCYVYLMVDLINKYHKIGISNKPNYREKTLQSEKPSIEMLCNKKLPNRKIAASFEQALHQTYADKRIRGEWFSLTEKEVEELKIALSD